MVRIIFAVAGSICSLDVSDVEDPSKRHRVWVSGRSKPRAITVDSNKQ